MAQQQIARQEKSLGDLFSELSTQTGELMRQEVALARVEMTQKAVKAGKDVGFLVVGGAVAYAAALAVIAAMIILLGQFIPVWLSALVIGLVVGVAAYFLISSALASLKRMDPAPRNTIETLKEDAAWLKKEMT
jgi:hypothetical protein